MQKWARLCYQPVLPLGVDGKRATASIQHRILSKKAAAEGAILLKNYQETLPLKKGTVLATFGKGIFDYVKGGGGSGDVTVSYVNSLGKGLLDLERQGRITLDYSLLSYYEEYCKEEYQKGILPGLMSEPVFPEEKAKYAATKTETAIIAISRFSGENWDRSSQEAPLFSSEAGTQKLLKCQSEVFEHGDYYLSEKEKDMVQKVTELFSKVIVVLNVGGIVDVSWISSDEKISAAIQGLQGGMEGGSAIAEILIGDINPCGRLTDTYARDLSDYPSSSTYHDSLDMVEYQEDIFVGYRFFDTIPGAHKKVIYPFGYGLSYTSFSIVVQSCSFSNDRCQVNIEVKNTGKVKGKDVVELFVVYPKGKIDKPYKSLVAFAKTDDIAPGESQICCLDFSPYCFSSYDEEGIIEESAWILEKGDYIFQLTDNGIKYIELSTSFKIEKDIIFEKVTHKLNESLLSKKLKSDGTFIPHVKKGKTLDSVLGRQNSMELEGVIPVERYREKRSTRAYMNETASKESFLRVADGSLTLEEFISNLPIDVMVDLVGGQPNRGVANTYGFGNQIEYGIPNVMTADGPAGLRIDEACGIYTTAWPCSTLLASTWDKTLIESIGKSGGLEVKENNIGVWLTPAVNIHRSPLCGRNFEYYSEDPLLTGILASYMVKGIQSNGIGACVKHFACNNKETNRKDSDSRVSERALREIYLKQFEIIIKESQPLFVMSSYNIINGIRAAENKELLTDILRGEWHFEGAVCSDWWNHSEHYLELLAGEDLKMANGYPERIKEALAKNVITKEDIEYNVRRILSVILRLE